LYKFFGLLYIRIVNDTSKGFLRVLKLRNMGVPLLLNLLNLRLVLLVQISHLALDQLDELLAGLIYNRSVRSHCSHWGGDAVATL
jgi:hypothetical protein